VHNSVAFVSKINTEGKNVLAAIDIETGDLLWEWKDVLKEDEEIRFNDFFVNDEVFYFHRAYRLYSIDINSGMTIAKQNSEYSFNFEFPISENIAYMGGNLRDDNTRFQYKIYKHDPLTQSTERIEIPEIYNRTNDSIDVGIGDAEYFQRNGKEYLVLHMMTKNKENDFQPYLGLYDLGGDSLIYLGYPINSAGGGRATSEGFRVLGNKVYTISFRDAVCFDLWTGEELWRQQFETTFAFGEFEVADGVMICHGEDQKIYGLDAEDGRLIWTQEGSGISSSLRDRVLNGVAYIAGGNSDRIHAIDIQTGKELWLLDPERYERGYENLSDLYVDHDLERVIFFVGNHVYCVEAER
jgi:outer membrane protein assembly factor BamB